MPDRIREILECFYDRYKERLGWAMVAAVTALFFCGVDLWVWRVAVVDPCIGECRNFRAQFERQVEMHHAEISDLDRRTARIEGLLQLDSIRKRP